MKTPKIVHTKRNRYFKAVLAFILVVTLWVPYLVSAAVLDVVALHVHSTEKTAAAFGWQDPEFNGDYRQAANLREELSNRGGMMRIVSSSRFETRFLVNLFMAVILVLFFFVLLLRFRAEYYSELGKYLAWKKQRYAASSRG